MAMAGPHDPYGPQDPGNPHGRPGGRDPHQEPGGGERGGRQGPEPAGRHRAQGPGDGGASSGPFKRFEPGPGYGRAARYPDPYDRYGPSVPEKRSNGYDHDRPPGQQRRIRVVRLWAGGVVVALVAALAAAVALLLVRGVLEIPVFAPEQEGTMAPASTGRFALGAALAALAATAVLNLLMLATPRPGRFFGWIVALATAAAMLLPFTADASWETKAGTAGVCLVVGLVIGTLLTTVARTAADGTDDRAARASGDRR